MLIKKTLKLSAVGLGALVAVLGLSYGICILKRPARTPEKRALFQGVDYERFSPEQPRPLVFHVVTVDLTAPGIDFLVTPQSPDPGGKDTLADTVPGFLEKHGVQVAINGSFFYPMYVNHAFDYAPRVGEGVNAVGLAISNGDRYSEVEAGWAALCIMPGGRSPSSRELTFSSSGDCPADTVHALAGDRIFIKDGQLVVEANRNQLFPRSVVALDKDRKTMWWVVVDGRQAGYSEGVTLAELAEELIARGADQALNLDGGGSTAMAIENSARARVLNSPIQARGPTHHRPVVNHLGLYARPLETSSVGQSSVKTSSMDKP